MGLLTADLLSRQAAIPDPAYLTAQATAWDSALAAIPDAQFGRVLQEAWRLHTGAYPLTAGDVKAWWEADRAERAARPVYTRPALPAARCRVCGDAGWVQDRRITVADDHDYRRQLRRCACQGGTP